MDRIKVLIASEEPIFRMGLSHLLSQEEDMEVMGTTEDGQEAIALASELLPDVIILSATIPNLGGIEASGQIKASSPRTGIVILSSYCHGAYLLPALRAGAAGYVLRTAPIDDLFNAIRSVNAGGETLDARAVSDILHRFAIEQLDQMESHEELNKRELDILKLAARGFHNRGIADQLHITERTVQTHLANIFRRLRVGSRTEAVLHAVKSGLLPIENLP